MDGESEETVDRFGQKFVQSSAELGFFIAPSVHEPLHLAVANDEGILDVRRAMVSVVPSDSADEVYEILYRLNRPYRR